MNFWIHTKSVATKVFNWMFNRWFGFILQLHGSTGIFKNHPISNAVCVPIQICCIWSACPKDFGLCFSFFKSHKVIIHMIHIKKLSIHQRDFYIIEPLSNQFLHHTAQLLSDFFITLQWTQPRYAITLLLVLSRSVPFQRTMLPKT